MNNELDYSARGETDLKPTNDTLVELCMGRSGRARMRRADTAHATCICDLCSSVSAAFHNDHSVARVKFVLSEASSAEAKRRALCDDAVCWGAWPGDRPPRPDVCACSTQLSTYGLTRSHRFVGRPTCAVGRPPYGAGAGSSGRVPCQPLSTLSRVEGTLKMAATCGPAYERADRRVLWIKPHTNKSGHLALSPTCAQLALGTTLSQCGPCPGPGRYRQHCGVAPSPLLQI